MVTPLLEEEKNDDPPSKIVAPMLVLPQLIERIVVSVLNYSNIYSINRSPRIVVWCVWVRSNIHVFEVKMRLNTKHLVQNSTTNLKNF